MVEQLVFLCQLVFLHHRDLARHSYLNETVCKSPQALANSTIEYENLEAEVSALHDDLWEQLNLDIQVRE